MWIISVQLYSVVDACRHSVLKRTFCKTCTLSGAIMMLRRTKYDKIPTYGTEEI